MYVSFYRCNGSCFINFKILLNGAVIENLEIDYFSHQIQITDTKRHKFKVRYEEYLKQIKIDSHEKENGHSSIASSQQSEASSS